MKLMTTSVTALAVFGILAGASLSAAACEFHKSHVTAAVTPPATQEEVAVPPRPSTRFFWPTPRWRLFPSLRRRNPSKRRRRLKPDPKPDPREAPAAGPAFLLAGARRGRQMWIGLNQAASAASFTASDSVGWAWQMRPRSSAEPANSISTEASAISSPA